MTDSARVRAIFSQAAERAGAERQTYLDEACAGEAAMRARVETLLAAAEKEDEFLAAPTQRPADGTIFEPLREGPGTVIGRYKLLQQIGEGGFGVVFLAEQREPVVRKVALKVIKLGMDTRAVVARFEHERQALAMMDHANIAKVLDAGATDTGRPYFVMELVKGDPITAYCDRHNLSVEERLGLFQQVCHAVQHAHQKGIIHRDIKPSNVLVTLADGKPIPKVIDFGIAKATSARLTEKTLFTEHRALIGTPEYMSPEQAEMTGVDIDTRSDVYSLGVLLYELLTGALPFDAKRLRSAAFGEIQRIIREEDPPNPSTRLSTLETIASVAVHRHTEPARLSRQVRGDLDWIVMKCLEKDRTRRYETASGLAQDVERHLAGEPVAAAPPSTGYKVRKFVRRHKVGVAAGTAIAAALVLGVAGTSAGLAWALREQGRAEQRRVEAEAAQGREREQRELAQKREKETRQVSDFQAAMLGEIDVEAMGRGIKDRFREQVRAALERQYVGEFPDRRKRTPEEIEAELVAFDERADTAQAVDVARQVMHEFVLARAANALEKEFADQPLVRAQLHDAIGNTYEELGLYVAGEPHLRAALEIRQRELGEEHPDVGISMNDLAQLLDDKGDYAGAEPLIRKALALFRRRPGDEHLTIAPCLTTMAHLMAAKGDYSEAERLMREALEITRKAYGHEHRDVARCLNALGTMLYIQRKYAVAEPLLREALAMCRKLLGDEHVEVGASMTGLAVLLMRRGDYAAAEPLYTEALAIARKTLGNEHQLSARALQNLGTLFATRGDYAAAEPLHREALAIRRKILGDEHPEVAFGLIELAQVLLVITGSDVCLTL